MEKYLNKLWYYFKKLWHQYIVCDVFVIVLNSKLVYGEKLQTTYGQNIEILWKEKEGEYYKYWVRNVQ